MLAVSVAAIGDTLDGLLDRAQFLQVAVDLGEVDVHHQVRERLVLEVVDFIRDLHVLLGVAAQQHLAYLLAQLAGTVTHARPEFRDLTGVEVVAHPKLSGRGGGRVRPPARPKHCPRVLRYQ